jgi:hypothetical protein
MKPNKVLELEAENQGNLRKRTRFDDALTVVDVGRRKIGKYNSTETSVFAKDQVQAQAQTV